MKAYLIALVSLAALFSPARSESQEKKAAPRGWNVVFYQKTKYRGAQKTVKSEMPTVDAAWSRRVKSAVIIGMWELCTGANFTGDCQTLRSSIADLKAYGFTGPVKSIRPVVFRKTGKS